MAVLLRICDWKKYFENNRTRNLKQLTWVPVPNKHDGDGFTDLMARSNAMAIYGAWHLILQIASKCDPRGTLMRDCKKPHDAASIARLTRGDEKIIDDAINVLVEIGWLEASPYELIDYENPAPSCGNLAPSCGNPAPSCLEGKEGNGMEGKGMEPPTIDEIESYCRERKNQINPKRFMDYYTANGWVQGNGQKPVRDWKAVIRLWEENKFPQSNNEHPQKSDKEIASLIRKLEPPLNWGPRRLQLRFEDVGFDELTVDEQTELISAFRKSQR